jgi:hypothetical protein
MRGGWKGTVYSLHPGYAMEETSKANLAKRTGKSLDEWVGIVNESGLAQENERCDWLKSDHGFTTNYAAWVVERASGRGAPEQYDPAGMVDEMFAGPKAALRPLYERLLEVGFSLGEDVSVCPCATIVPLYRKHVFAQIKPTTRTRIDLGLALKGVDSPPRLIDTGGAAKGDRITHRIPIASLDEIDDEAVTWIRIAYERDA